MGTVERLLCWLCTTKAIEPRTFFVTYFIFIFFVLWCFFMCFCFTDDMIIDALCLMFCWQNKYRSNLYWYCDGMAMVVEVEIWRILAYLYCIWKQTFYIMSWHIQVCHAKNLMVWTWRWNAGAVTSVTW